MYILFGAHMNILNNATWCQNGETRQVSTLLYCMEDQADSVLTSTKIATEDRLKYNSVMSKFDTYFKVRWNVIIERARFNQCNQLAGESVEQYIIVLYTLVKMYTSPKNCYRID